MQAVRDLGIVIRREKRRKTFVERDGVQVRLGHEWPGPFLQMDFRRGCPGNVAGNRRVRHQDRRIVAVPELHQPGHGKDHRMVPRVNPMQIQLERLVDERHRRPLHARIGVVVVKKIRHGERQVERTGYELRQLVLSVPVDVLPGNMVLAVLVRQPERHVAEQFAVRPAQAAFDPTGQIGEPVFLRLVGLKPQPVDVELAGPAHFPETSFRFEFDLPGDVKLLEIETALNAVSDQVQDIRSESHLGEAHPRPGVVRQVNRTGTAGEKRRTRLSVLNVDVHLRHDREHGFAVEHEGTVCAETRDFARRTVEQDGEVRSDEHPLAADQAPLLVQ